MPKGKPLDPANPIARKKRGGKKAVAGGETPEISKADSAAQQVAGTSQPSVSPATSEPANVSVANNPSASGSPAFVEQGPVTLSSEEGHGKTNAGASSSIDQSFTSAPVSPSSSRGADAGEKGEGSSHVVTMAPAASDLDFAREPEQPSNGKHAFPKHGDKEQAFDIQAEIRKRAYELFVERGSVSGNEHEDWLRAEREVMSRYARTA